jgi:hypothetical protein
MCPLKGKRLFTCTAVPCPECSAALFKASGSTLSNMVSGWRLRERRNMSDVFAVARYIQLLNDERPSKSGKFCQARRLGGVSRRRCLPQR